MLTLEDLRAINIEISSRCAARCPFCSRQQKVRPYGAHDITLAEFQRLPKRLLQKLERISFAGNFGDFCSNPAFPDIAAYAREVNPALVMDGDTNGSLQPDPWWRRLGRLFNRGSSLIFALDGLEDTHALHRRGTAFNKILDHLEAFTAAGGDAYWKFVLFAHNEHQIQDAEALARETGCKGFLVTSSRDYDETCRRPKTFELQLKRELYHENWQRLAAADRYARCKPFSEGSVYIAADGTVHPCCFAHCMYITEHNDRFGFIVPLIEAYRPEINFRTRPLAEILGHPYFEAVHEKSKTSDYCILKCNRKKKDIREKLVIYETHFN